jgi:uncharacterized protein
MEIDFVDSHLHLDNTFAARPRRISWLVKAGCMAVSWAFAQDAECISHLKNYLGRLARTIAFIRQGPLECFYLSGIHPRNITPDLTPSRVRETVLPFLDDPLCLGVGEIGLEKGTAREEDILCAHLELGDEVAERGKVFGIHTPRKDKVRVTGRLLEVLKPYSRFRDMVVVDHCTPETINDVLSRGLWAGVTVSPIKSAIEDVREITNNHPESLERIMLNTDSGSTFYEDLHELYRSGDLDGEIKELICRENALCFFGL